MDAHDIEELKTILRKDGIKKFQELEMEELHELIIILNGNEICIMKVNFLFTNLWLNLLYETRCFHFLKMLENKLFLHFFFSFLKISFIIFSISYKFFSNFLIYFFINIQEMVWAGQQGIWFNISRHISFTFFFFFNKKLQFVHTFSATKWSVF